MKSIYIHIPFCRKICSYCDFPKVYYNEGLVDKYLIALKKEIDKTYDLAEVKSLYIGGGTPSALNKQQLEELFKILSIIKIAENAEETIELNVEDISQEKMQIFKNFGINRLSIGIQTVNEKFFNFLNRGVAKEIVLEKILIARKYFDNISIDFIYGFPNQTISDLEIDLSFIKKFNPDHISIYSLIIEENTKLFIDKTKALDDNLENKMYYKIIKTLEDLAFTHYEISNFAKEDKKSIHNLTYWNNEEYFGFGMGAASYANGKRYSNTKSIDKYIAGETIYISEEIDALSDMQYFMILGLRKISGVSKEEFKRRYKKDIKEVFPIDKLIADGLLIENDYNILVTKEKLYLQNQILSYFI